MDENIPHLIDRYVSSLKKTGDIRSKSVEAAFRQVPRHRLLKEIYSGSRSRPDVLAIDVANPEHLAMIYSDRAFMIRGASAPSSTSQPGLMAGMLELLNLRPGMRVLEIGAGSGYNAALMAEMVSNPKLITTIDNQKDLVEQTRQQLELAGYGEIRVLIQDGFYGCEREAPYDRVVATVGCSDLSPNWLAQLGADGFMLIPLSHGGVGHCPLVQVAKEYDDNRVQGVLSISDRAVGRIVAHSYFMPIRSGEFSQDLWSLSSDDEELELIRLIRMVEPVGEYPLFKGIEAIPDPQSGIPDEWAGRIDFHYFLALHTRQTFSCWTGTGLGDEKSCVLVGEDSIQLFGDKAHMLYQELESIFRKWEQLGKPRMRDYTLEFIPLSEISKQEQNHLSDCATSPESREVAQSESQTWAIDRRFFRQIVRL